MSWYMFCSSFSHFAREFVEKIPDKRLTLQKMDCIHNMVKTELFEDQGTERNFCLIIFTSSHWNQEQRNDLFL